MAAEESIPYLYMPVMQTKNPYTERERKDRGQVSEMWHYIYKEKLIRKNTDCTGQWLSSVITVTDGAATADYVSKGEKKCQIHTVY